MAAPSRYYVYRLFDPADSRLPRFIGVSRDGECAWEPVWTHREALKSRLVLPLAGPHGKHVVTLIAADVGDSGYVVEARSRSRRSPSSIQFRTVRPETPRRRPAESNVQPSSQISRIAVD